MKMTPARRKWLEKLADNAWHKPCGPEVQTARYCNKMQWTDSDIIRDLRAVGHRYYAITPAGRAALAKAREEG